ncbi:MAG TPA: hypothetical protein PK307_14285 [Spirochaetota bacterium]|nr:hypothetical protein [Spirochaetota bacterium]HOD15817.1 hypothetical protein [Spirochaetota bacterium]HPN14069.1 hypothetical protein [Spirochaetota bacterium]HQL83368.1 hypothetical protein [Spirochaetota bacterium]
MGSSEPDECDQYYHRTVPLNYRPDRLALRRIALFQNISSGSAGQSFRPALHAHA